MERTITHLQTANESSKIFLFKKKKKTIKQLFVRLKKFSNTQQTTNTSFSIELGVSGRQKCGELALLY